MMLHKVFVIICLTTICIIGNESARILVVIPTPSISHQLPFRPLTQELAKRGHEVVVITADPAFPKGQAPTNLTEIDVHELAYLNWQHFVVKSTGKKEEFYVQIIIALDEFMNIVERFLHDKEIQKLMTNKDKAFDLLLLEDCNRPALAFSHVWKVPVILISSFGSVFNNYGTIGASTHAFLHPPTLRRRIYNLTLWEKLTELYDSYWLESYYKSHEAKENEMLRRHFGADIPTLNELNNNVDIMLLNVHPMWDGNRPVPPGLIYMGGIHEKPEKELPQELKSYLDSSVEGVIYMSFGTNVNPSLLPPEIVQVFVKVFSQVPYAVLWKWDTDELPGRPENVRIMKWLPQSDLLRHRNVKLFITQGGLQSTEEAIIAGVPLIGIPMLAEQWYNTEQYLKYKIGLKFELETVKEKELLAAIGTIINDKSYVKNIKKLNKLIHDEPQAPMERAVWWIEYVLRNGGARHLRTPSANLSWAEYLELDLIKFIVVLSLAMTIFLSVSVYMINRLIKKIITKQSKINKKLTL